MKEIDIDSWNRKEHFRFFLNTPYPIYNISYEVDVTDVKEYCARTGVSFNNAMLYLSTASANETENFRYRLRGDKVVLHEKLHPSFAALDKGATLFKFVTVDWDEDLIAFDRKAKAAVRDQKEFFPMEKVAGRDDLIFFSALPWISFTSLDHTRSLKQADAVQRISWGKYFRRDGRLIIPYNIQVSHLFVDGYHLGQFKEIMDKKINGLK